MSETWIEPIENSEVKQWAYERYISGTVVFSGDRQKQGYPVVAEFYLSDKDLETFDGIDKGASIIMYPVDRKKTIDDPEAMFEIHEIKFDLECSD